MALIRCSLFGCVLALVVISTIVETNGSKFEEAISLTPQAELVGGTFWFGSQLAVADGKLMPGNAGLEGAKPRKKASVKPFAIDIACVTNLQFSQFVRSTGYQTDSEKFQWSFVFEALLQEAGLEGIIAQTDDPEHGMGRVKTSLHWLGVHGANWFHPLGQHVVYPTKPSKRATEAAQKEAKGETVKPVYAKKGQKQLERERGEAEAANDRLSVDALGLWDRPVVHVSHNDAVAYCTWSNSVDQDAAEVAVDGSGGGASRGKRRLPTEREWEFAARGGLHNQSYPWGDGSVFVPGQMNVWETDAAYASHTKSPGDLLKGKMGGVGPDGGLAIEFPAIESNTRADGHLGVAPAQSFPTNAYGLYNMLGNVWEWVAGGNEKERVLRGGSFLDSVDGSFNHIVLTSTRQTNSADSSASNVGFRCARSLSRDKE